MCPWLALKAREGDDSHDIDDAEVESAEVVESFAIPEADIAATIRTLLALGENLELYRAKELKPVRVALQPLFRAQQAGLTNIAPVLSLVGAKRARDTDPQPAKQPSLGAVIAESCRFGRWPAALAALRTLYATGVVPRLGAVQRWVRAAACDVCMRSSQC
jgi:hypothetical protein